MITEIKSILQTWKMLSLAKKQIILSYLLKGLSIFVSLAYIPLALSYLSSEKFGIWITITSVVSWIKLFDVGIGNGLRHHLASSLALGDREKSSELITSTYFIMTLIFASVLILFLLINPFLSWQEILNSNSTNQSVLINVTAIGVSCMLLTFIMQLIKIIFAAHGNTALGTAIDLSGSALALLVLWLLSLFTVPGNLTLAVIAIVGSPLIIYLIVTIVYFRIKRPDLCPRISELKLKENVDLFKLSGKFFVVQITATIIYTSTPFIITQLYGPTAVSEYHVARSIFNLGVILIGLTTAPIIPIITREFAVKNYVWIQQALRNSVLFSIGISLLIIVLIFVSPWVYNLWLGDEIFVAKNLSVAIGVYSIIQVLVKPLSSFINAIGRINVLVWLSPLGIMLYILSIYFLNDIINNVSAIVWALSLTSLIGLIVEPFVLRKYLFPKNTK